MAEAAVGIAIDKLVWILTEEVSSLKDLKEDVKELVLELATILSDVKDADKRAEVEGENVSDGFKSWVQELREISLEIEDVVTEYKHCMDKKQRPRYQWSFVQCLREIACVLPFHCSILKQRHDLARQIQDINKRLRRITERSKRHGFINSIQQGSASTETENVSNSYDPRKASRYLQEDELVGIESPRDELVGILLNESSQRTIIPVVGMGGSGKTTLAQKVYNDVHGTFHYHAWVEVPQPYKIEEILRKLTRELLKSTKASVPDEIHAMDEKELTLMLREYLKGKKYLVIFDDVWKEDFWGDIRHALIDDKVGGRIMITTRHMQVAEFCGSFSAVHIHQMQRLSIEKSWDLFCRKTFRPECHCPEELEKISGDIVERCEGLPLAIVVIAGVLSTKKKTINEWQRFHASLSVELENNIHLKSITKILSLSYYELPHYLKSCLLYFGMFPEHHSIRNGRLIRQWIAEGFVTAVKGKTLEEVSQAYMNELINRSLVEASALDVTGRPKECRVHDLLHEVILKKTKEVRFCQVLPESSADQSRFGGITRRLSIMNNSSNDVLRRIALSPSSEFSHVHAAVIFCEDETLNSFVPIFAINFKFIKVLDFEDAPHLDHLPEDIGNLFNLRYLGARETKASVLPRSMENLENLETLQLEKSLVCEIPAFIICKLRKLRHLLGFKREAGAPFGSVGIKVMGGIGRLKALQKLYKIEADVEGVDGLFKELESLTQLKTLGISKLSMEDGVLLCLCVGKMKLLESLTVFARNESEFVDLEYMSSPPQFLRNLNLGGRLHKLPEWFKLLENLVKLGLRYSMLEADPLEVLGKMPSLLELTFGSDAYVGEQLHFKEGMFPKLKKLCLLELSSLRSLLIEETALPVLEELYIGSCPQMKEVPSGLQHLQNLKTLVYHLSPTSPMPLQLLLQHVFLKDREGQQWLARPQDLLRRQRKYWNKDGETEKQEAQDEASTSKSIIEEQ